MIKKDPLVKELVKLYKKKLEKIKDNGNYKKVSKFTGSILAGLEFQLTLTPKNLKNLPEDDFILGYIWGFTDASFQNLIGKDLDYWSIVSYWVYDNIYGPKISNLILQKIRFFNSDQEFIKGTKNGILDAHEGLLKSQSFTRLAEYVTKNYT